MDNLLTRAREMLHRRRLDALSLGGASEISVGEIDEVLNALAQPMGEEAVRDEQAIVEEGTGR